MLKNLQKHLLNNGKTKSLLEKKLDFKQKNYFADIFLTTTI